MEHMVEGYLAFARGEGREMPAPTDLAGLLRDVVAQMTRDGRTVDLHVEQDLMLPLRREAMRRCLTTLLANSQRHGKHDAARAGRRQSPGEVKTGRASGRAKVDQESK